MFAFEFGVGNAVDFPNGFAGPFVESNDFSGSCIIIASHGAVDQLQEESILVEGWCGGETKLDIDGSEAVGHLELPHFFSVELVAGEDTVAEHAPDEFTIGAGGGRGGVAFAGAGVLVTVGHDLFPQQFAVVAIEGEEDEVISLGGGDEEFGTGDDGCGAAGSGEWTSPEDVIFLVPFRGSLIIVGDPILLWTAPLMPILSLHCVGGPTQNAERPQNDSLATHVRTRFPPVRTLRILIQGHGFRANDIFGEADLLHEQDDPPGHVEFKPAMAMMSGPRLRMVIIMPAFAVRNQGDEPVIPAIVASFVVFIAEDVCERIDAPGTVQHDDGSDEDAPDEPAHGGREGRADTTGDRSEEATHEGHD